MDSTTVNEIKHSREFFDGLGRIYPAAANVKINAETIDGRSCYWFVPENKVGNKLIIYFHGGAYGMGSIHSHKAMVSHLADSLKTTVLFIEYALAPEHPYPAGVNDALAVYEFILKTHKASDIIMMGDSAGGGILLSSLGKMQEVGLKFPAGIIMLCPWLELACDNNSYTQNKATDPVLTQEELKKFAAWYAPGHAAKASAASTDLKTLPPVLLMAGSGEILLDDSRHFYERAKKLQKNTTFHIYPNQPHVWPLTDIQSTASQKLIQDVRTFMASLK